jgi:hypothetical protein
MRTFGRSVNFARGSLFVLLWENASGELPALIAGGKLPSYPVQF